MYFNNERNDFYLWDEEWARHVRGDALLLPEGVEKWPGFPYIAFDPNLIISYNIAMVEQSREARLEAARGGGGRGSGAGRGTGRGRGRGHCWRPTVYTLSQDDEDSLVEVACSLDA